jgi:hypothetical protein
MILTVIEKYRWDNVVLWKMDLQGAFNLLWFRANVTSYLAFPLTNNRAAIHLAGMFGWVGMPYVFQVITRAVLALCATLIIGICLMYVDDIMGASPASHGTQDMTAVAGGVTGLMGPNSLAIKKNEAGRDLDWLGWRVDLDYRAVTISERNLLKTLHAFFDFNLTEQLTLQQVERMASLASRCSQLNRAMRPYTVALYGCASDYKGCRHTKRQLTALAKVEVMAWRAFLVMSRFDREHMSRPIASFAARAPSLGLEYDASLGVISAGASTMYPPSTEKHLIAYTNMVLPFEATTDASYQNTYEFLAIVLGTLLAICLGLRNRAGVPWGDSMSSLKWALKDRVASTIARRANIVYTLIAARFDITVDSTQHVPGKKNVIWDGLTRGKTPAELGLPPNIGTYFTPDHPVSILIGLCDPRIPLTTYAEHTLLSQKTILLLDQLQLLPIISLPDPQNQLLSNKIAHSE